MFENETKFITDFILNKIKNTGTGVTVNNLLPQGVHPAILKFISSELDYLIFAERKKLLDNSAFDYSTPEVTRYFSLISEELKNNKLIGFDDIKKLVVQAVSFNLNFICRPKWALIKLVFDGKETVSSEEIKMLLNHIYYYDYLRDIISTYITKRDLKRLSAIEFELIINKIDKELFFTEGKKLTENMLWAVGEFINIGGSSIIKIPIQPVEVFLKEKNQIEMLFRLRRAFPADSKNRYEVDDIKNIIFSSTPIDKISFEPAAEEKTAVEDVRPLPEVDFSEEETEISFEEDEPDEPETEQETESAPSEEPVDDFDIDLVGEEDILKIYDEELKSLEELEQEFDIKTEEDPDRDFIFEEGSDTDKAEKIEQELLTSEEFAVTSEDSDIAADDIERQQHIADAEEENKAPKEKSSRFSFFRKKESVSKKENKEITDFFSEKELNKIVSVIFNEDKDDFYTTLEKIGECQNYDEATEIIKSVFLTYRINPYTREAVMLTNAVANYFNQG